MQNSEINAQGTFILDHLKLIFSKTHCIKKARIPNFTVFRALFLEIMGFEPTASRMRTERSPTELYPHAHGI